jgi:demethylmenaquinone methyltransferase/2-methoxy-6-polyprenyl-1,4-benzoquinol methylase
MQSESFAKPENPHEYSSLPKELTDFGYLKVPENEKVNWVRRHFNTVAHNYDFMNTLLSFGIHYVWKRIAVEMMHLEEGARVLDVCGGTADLSLLAAKHVGSSGRVVLYDINWAMMVAGKPKTLSSPFGKTIQYTQGDAERIAFADESFDAAMVGFGIRNLTHMEQGFREMHRVLKPGGKLMCLEFSEPVTPWFRCLYDFYSFHIMPALGNVLAGCRHAYTYLPESIRLFPMPEELKQILEGIGFSRIVYRRLTDGIAVIHLGIKR